MKYDGIDEIIRMIYATKPFYGYILYRINRKWDNKIPTACVDLKRNLMINKDFFDSLDLSSKMGVIEHEILHLALLHIPRFHSFLKNPLFKDIANIAMDCAINQLITFKITNMNEFVTLELVEELVGKRLKPYQHAEYYFKELIKKRNKILKKIQGSKSLQQLLSNIAAGHEKMNKGSEGEGEMIDPLSESVLRQILQKAKEIQDEVDRQMGTRPEGYFTSFLPEYVEHDKNIWKKLIHKVIGSEPSADKEYIFGKISRRKNDCYWGYKHLQESNKVYIGIDTSGSTFEEQSIFVGVVAKALRVQDMCATIIQCDTAIHEVQEKVNKINIKNKYKAIGGGGTDLTKILDYIEEKEKGKKARLVLLTDGYTPWRISNSIITTCIYTKDHTKLNNVLYSAVLEK